MQMHCVSSSMVAYLTKHIGQVKRSLVVNEESFDALAALRAVVGICVEKKVFFDKTLD